MNDDDLLTVQEVATKLRASDETVRRLLRRGKLKGFRYQTGSTPWRIRVRDLNDYISCSERAKL